MPQPDERPGYIAQDPADSLHQFRADQGEPPCLGGQLASVCLVADPSGLIGAGPRDHEAARQQPITGPLTDRLGLPGQQRLIGLQAGAVPDEPVRDQLIARAQRDQVPGHQLRDGHVLR